MSWEMQSAAALVVVALAAAYLGRLGWQTIARRRTPGCGSCVGCPSNQAGGSDVVQIGGTPPISGRRGK